MKKDRHYYYQMLKNNNELFYDKSWLKEAMICTLERHAGWTVKEKNLDAIIVDNNFTSEEFLDFIAMENKIISKKLRELEQIAEFAKEAKKQP